MPRYYIDAIGACGSIECTIQEFADLSAGYKAASERADRLQTSLGVRGIDTCLRIELKDSNQQLLVAIYPPFTALARPKA